MNQATPGRGPETVIGQLEELLKSPISPEQFYRSYLDILARMRGFCGGHLWLLQGREFVPLGGSELKTVLYDTDAGQKAFILEHLRRCAATEKTVMVPSSGEPGEERNKCRFSLVFTPMLVGRGAGATQGGQVTWWTPEMIGKESDLSEVLDACSAYAARVMRSQKLESMAQISDQLQQMTLFLAEIGAAADLESLAVAVANRAREIVGCDRAALIYIESDGALRIGAISNVPAPDPRSSVGRTILQLADGARSGGLPAIFRKASEKTEEKGDISDYFYHSNMEEVMVLGVQSSNQPICGLLLFESTRSGFFEASKQQSASAIATQAAGMLALNLSAEQIPFRKQLQRLAAWRQLPPTDKKRWLLRRLWVPAAAVTLLALLPLKFQLSGEARILPRDRAIAVAETEGRIVNVKVRDGERVKKDDVLLQIDNAEARKQLDIAVEEESRLRAEADRLMSLNERAAAQVANLQLERARKEKKYREDALGKTLVRSPIDGIIMTPDLSSRQGDAVVPGSQLAMVGNPLSWNLEVSLPESDVAILLRRLQMGEDVPVIYLLNSLPNRRLSATVRGSDSISSASEVVAGRNVFRVIVPLPDDPEFASLLRSGYSGRARLTIGRRPLVYLTTRRFVNWVRTNVLF